MFCHIENIKGLIFCLIIDSVLDLLWCIRKYWCIIVSEYPISLSQLNHVNDFNNKALDLFLFKYFIKTKQIIVIFWTIITLNLIIFFSTRAIHKIILIKTSSKTLWNY